MVKATKKCSVIQCELKVKAKGFCSKHYQRWRKHGMSGVDPAPKQCSADGCEQTEAITRGLCAKHYTRMLRHGDPHTVINFADPKEAFNAKIKHSDGCTIWTGLKNDRGYGRMYANGDFYYAHRYAWEQVNGPIPDGMMIDHICHNPSCVNIDHLRLASRSQNVAYAKGARSDSQTGVRNVLKVGRYWGVRVIRNGERHWFGTFRTIEEASEVAKQARRELFGEFASLG